MIERIHLAILREVRRRGSLTAAADALHLTQPALSHAMKKLETQCGTPVWRREGRNLRLTPAGEQIYALAERLLPQLEQTEETLRGLARGERGCLRIGMECHPCYEWLLKVVQPFLERWPRVDLDVRQSFRFGGIDALQRHEIDLLVTPDPVHGNGLRFEPVFAYELVLAVAGGHPLAQAACAEPEDLADEILITYPVPVDRLDIYTRFLLPAGVRPKRRQSIEATAIMLQMAASGRGVTALPRWLVDEYAARMPIAAVRLGQAGIHKAIHLGVRAEEGSILYLSTFISQARQTGDPSP